MATNLKQVKKKWYPITASKLFNETAIGETYLTDAQEAVGKKIIVNLSQITNDMQRQNFNAQFRIVKAEKDVLKTKMINYFMMPAALRKVSRREKDKIESSFLCKTKDEEDIRVKTVLVARKKISQSISAHLQRTAQEVISKNLKASSYEQFINDILTRKIQNELGKELKKVYPLSFYEIRWAELLDTTKTTPAEKTQAQESSVAIEA